MEQAILRKWLKAGFMDKHVLYPTEAGVPQGGVVSPVIMNLALNGLERHIKGAFPAFQGAHRTKVHVIRFADDFIITGQSKAFLEQEVQPLVEQFLAERGLALSHEKTRITHIEDGFDFLGTHVRKYRGKLLCTPAKKNVQAFLDTIRGIVKRHKQAITGQPDHATQSRDSGLGAVSPAWGEQADLCAGRSSDLYPAVAVGAAETPAQISPVDSGQVFPIRRRE